MFRKNTSSKKFDTFMVLLLFFLFAATAFSLIMLGIKQYRITADSMNTNYEVRTASSYLTEKVRQFDTNTGITIESLDGTDAITMKEELDGKTYTTYIYFYDGYIRELYVSEDSIFDIAGGQAIIETGNLEIRDLSNSTIELVITSTKGEKTPLYLSTKSF